MSRQPTPTADARPRSRWPLLLAGIAALGVAAARTIFGGRYDLPLLVEGLERPAMAAVIYINWYALNVTFAALGVALLVATTQHRSAARAIATLAAIVFASTCALFLYYTHQATGSPFTFYPWIPLGLTAALSAFAAWRA